jgi:hypothetical protein
MSTYLTKSARISWELVVNQRLATYLAFILFGLEKDQVHSY